MEQQKVLPHLFRTQHQKMIAVLVRLFGTQFLQVAEDIVSDCFLAAAELWGLKGLPENPAGWLYVMAKNKALDHLRRNKIFRDKVTPQLKLSTTSSAEDFDLDLSDTHVKDSQLAMLFVVCNPINKPAAQVALALNLLCGFGASEIASAFLTDRETVYKRLQRAKKLLQDKALSVEQPSENEIKERLPQVLLVVYLLFNEGYFSEGPDKAIREELCQEAMRLGILLTESPLTALPSTYALLALMCFHGSRFEARQDQRGELVLYQDQNRAAWDQQLINKGRYFLQKAMAEGAAASKFHLEAGIAFWHSFPEEQPQKWEQILKLYDLLLKQQYTPMAALNRVYALSKVEGKQKALSAMAEIHLDQHYLYHSLLAELYTDMDNQKAAAHLRQAVGLAKSPAGRRILDGKLRVLKEQL
ncbi:RNA polymerase sigma factor [Arachidicoccus ginsenosidivorans]|jgi:RNA polymerase sigma-70 factor (ECF subfamily)|uniref:RNA polymerase subunit sigma n=1 Tax=Arachidicoccus ginsenosidivorans TaxID=496057 RepID=A0A5B8VP10_9BACT|nr:DUF6596 domain-containing protein [Arachidicoccus ginsenosidivorans]QEC71998.1 RNA polymerase subunit sigma [Arachidicoccus ginsenosidivorans]